MMNMLLFASSALSGVLESTKLRSEEARRLSNVGKELEDIDGASPLQHMLPALGQRRLFLGFSDSNPTGEGGTYGSPVPDGQDLSPLVQNPVCPFGRGHERSRQH